MAKQTGVFIDENTFQRIMAIYERTREPLFGTTSLQTFRCATRIDEAMKELHEAIDAAAVAAGLPVPSKDDDGDVIHYGLLATREVTSV